MTDKTAHKARLATTSKLVAVQSSETYASVALELGSPLLDPSLWMSIQREEGHFDYKGRKLLSERT